MLRYFLVGRFPIAWPSRSGNACVLPNRVRTNMHIIIRCAVFADYLQARQAVMVTLVFAILFAALVSWNHDKVWGLCREIGLRCLECIVLIISGSVAKISVTRKCSLPLLIAALLMGRHFRVKLSSFSFLNLIAAHIIHNLNDEITLCITVYAFGRTKCRKG